MAHSDRDPVLSGESKQLERSAVSNLQSLQFAPSPYHHARERCHVHFCDPLVRDRGSEPRSTGDDPMQVAKMPIAAKRGLNQYVAMNRSRLLCTLTVFVASACGDVGHESVISMPDGGGSDAAPDASMAPTAISAEDVASFAALNGTPTVVPFTAVTYDDGHELDVQGRFTARASGDYEICASLGGFVALPMLLELFVDGTRYGGLGSGVGVARGCVSARIAAHQVVDIRIIQNSGATQGFTSNIAANWLTIYREIALVEVTANSPLSIPQAAFVTVPYQTVIHDDRHEFNIDTSQFIASVDGDYRLCASLGAPTGMGFELDLFKNELRERAFAISFGPGSGCRSIRLAANDRVGVGVYQELSPPGVIPPNPAWTRLTVAQLATEVSLGDTAGFSSSNGQFIRIPYIFELANDEHDFDISSNRYTVSTPGDFEVCASIINIVQRPLPVIELDIFKNGIRNKMLASSTAAAVGCHTLRAATGDTLEVDISASTYAYNGNAYWNWMTVRRRE